MKINQIAKRAGMRSRRLEKAFAQLSEDSDPKILLGGFDLAMKQVDDITYLLNEYIGKADIYRQMYLDERKKNTERKKNEYTTAKDVPYRSPIYHYPI